MNFSRLYMDRIHDFFQDSIQVGAKEKRKVLDPVPVLKKFNNDLL